MKNLAWTAVAAVSLAGALAWAQAPARPLQSDPSLGLRPFTIEPEGQAKIQARANPDKVAVKEPSDGFGRSLSVELFFDTYEDGGSRTSVAATIRRIIALQKPDPALSRPPTALLTWGTGLAFRGTLSAAQVEVLAKDEAGMPTRAVVRTQWKEVKTAEDQLKGSPRH